MKLTYGKIDSHNLLRLKNNLLVMTETSCYVFMAEYLNCEAQLAISNYHPEWTPKKEIKEITKMFPALSRSCCLEKRLCPYQIRTIHYTEITEEEFIIELIKIKLNGQS